MSGQNGRPGCISAPAFRRIQEELVLARLAILIDGGYLIAIAKQARIWVDYQKFSQEVTRAVDERTTEPVHLLRTYFYNCLPWQGSPPTEAERERYRKARNFHTGLENLPRYKVREGVLKKRDDGTESTSRFEQKRVDLMLGLDLATLSLKGHIQHAAVISGDNDFVPAFDLARGEGVLLWLFHERSSTSHELRNAADEHVVLDRNFLKRVEQARR